MPDSVVEMFGYPRHCSVNLPNHKSKHFKTLSYANLAIRVTGNNVEIIKNRFGPMEKNYTISDEDLVILKLKSTPID